jgi:ankyrin repeat protein
VISDFKNKAERASKQAIDDGIKEINRRFALIFEYLVNHSANLELVDDRGQTVLFSSINDTNLPALEMLVNAGADVNHHDGEGRTPLHLAVQVVKNRNLPENLMLPIFKALLKAGARSGEKDKAGKTPLDLAREYSLQGLEALLA